MNPPVSNGGASNIRCKDALEISGVQYTIGLDLPVELAACADKVGALAAAKLSEPIQSIVF